MVTFRKLFEGSIAIPRGGDTGVLPGVLAKLTRTLKDGVEEEIPGSKKRNAAEARYGSSFFFLVCPEIQLENCR